MLSLLCLCFLPRKWMLGCNSPFLIIRASKDNCRDTGADIVKSLSQCQQLLPPEVSFVRETLNCIKHIFSVTYSWKKLLKNVNAVGEETLLHIPLTWRHLLASCVLTAIWEGVLIEWPLRGVIGPELKALSTEGSGGDPALPGEPPSQSCYFSDVNLLGS